MKYYVLCDSTIGVLQEHNTHILVADWYLPNHEWYETDGPSLVFREYARECLDHTKLPISAEFETLDEFKEWFVKEYFVEML